MAKKSSAHKNRIIFSQGDPSDSVFYIQQGSVKFTVTSKEGREAITGILNGGSFFGVDALDSDRPQRSSGATTLTDVRAVKTDPDAMLRLIHTDRDVCNVFLFHLIRLNAKLTSDFADNLLYSSDKRLAHVLLATAQLYEDAQVRPLPKLGQQDLAI
jgi:CRP-like cAMP-binding protein